MDKVMIDSCIGTHSFEYFMEIMNGNIAMAKYHYGVITGFLSALYQTDYITSKEYTLLFKKYIWGQ